MRLFVYPQHKKNQIANPYLNNMEEALSSNFKIIHTEYSIRLPQPLRLLLGSFKSDVYVCNWIEDAAEGEGNSFLRGYMTLLALHILRKRKAKIIWIFHNIHPHSGETEWTKKIKRFLFKKSSLIVAHSKEAAEYAEQYACCPVEFRMHPVSIVDYGKWDGLVRDCDFFIWGNINPYKGVVEFVNNPKCKASGCKVLIIGKCENVEMANRIEKACDDNIVFENRSAGFAEIAEQCKKAKYVLFPYIGNSISSSGVLMDTLLMGGVPVGPDRGAFSDLKEAGCCILYKNINEIFELSYKIGKDATIDPESKRKFINENTWSCFSKWLFNKLNNI